MCEKNKIIKNKHWPVVIFAIIFLCIIGVISVLAAYVYIRINIVQMFKIPSATMAPALKPGDRVLVDKRAYMKEKPKRGNIIFYPSS